MNLKQTSAPAKKAEFKDKEKPAQIRSSNITAAKGKLRDCYDIEICRA